MSGAIVSPPPPMTPLEMRAVVEKALADLGSPAQIVVTMLDMGGLFVIARAVDGLEQEAMLAAARAIHGVLDAVGDTSAAVIVDPNPLGELLVGCVAEVCHENRLEKGERPS